MIADADEVVSAQSFELQQTVFYYLPVYLQHL